MSLETLGVAGLIFLARCADVTMGVFRILMLVKGRKILAAGLGFFEVMVFLMVMNAILGGGKSLSAVEVLAYCGGFATGNFIGSHLEGVLTNSYVLVEIITPKHASSEHLAERLRQEGFGATVLTGEGKDGPSLVFKLICFRKEVPRVGAIAKDLGCFSFVSDIKGISGGHFFGNRNLMRK
jgi:uncharacterized protein YebE (UPF0316 family)